MHFQIQQGRTRTVDSFLISAGKIVSINEEFYIKAAYRVYDFHLHIRRYGKLKLREFSMQTSISPTMEFASSHLTHDIFTPASRLFIYSFEVLEHLIYNRA